MHFCVIMQKAGYSINETKANVKMEKSETAKKWSKKGKTGGN